LILITVAGAVVYFAMCYAMGLNLLRTLRRRA
jgi:hypothetical protein